MVTEQEKTEILKLDKEGHSLREIEKKTGIPKSTVQKTVTENRQSIEEDSEEKNPPITGNQLTTEVFKLLEKGSTLPEIVIELKADPDSVQTLYDKWLDLKETDVNQPNLEEIYGDLAKLKMFLEEAKITGDFKQSQCIHFDEYCYGLTYTTRLGSDVHRKPTVLKCALCPIFSTEE